MDKYFVVLFILMFKVGEDFWGSKQETAWNLALVAPLTPLEKLAQWSLWATIDDPDYTKIILQERVGSGEGDADERLFDIEKTQTQDADGRTYNRLAKLERKLGLDELSQLANVRRREMNVFGWRPVLLKDNGRKGVIHHELLMDIMRPALRKEYLYVTQHSLPGILDDFSIWDHVNRSSGLSLEEKIEVRGVMTVESARKASIAANIKTLGNFVRTALSQELQ